MTAISTKASGSWSSASTWTSDPLIPGVGDTVDILSGHTVTIDQNIEVGADSTTAAIHVNTGGKLQLLYTAIADYTLTLQGDLSNDGTIEIGTVANPIPSSRKFTVKLNKSAAPADGKYGWLNNAGSTCTIQGYILPVWKALLTVDASVGATSITTDVSTGWVNGDIIVIAPTDRQTTQGAACQDEQRTVSSSSGTTVNIPALTYGHLGNPAFIQAEVINLTRNILITVDNTSYYSYTTHADSATVDIDGVEFSYLGTNAANKYGIGIFTGTTAGANTFRLENCSIHDSLNYAIYAATTTNRWSLKNLALSKLCMYAGTCYGVFNGGGRVGGLSGSPMSIAIDNLYLIGAGSGNYSSNGIAFSFSYSFNAGNIFEPNSILVSNLTVTGHRGGGTSLSYVYGGAGAIQIVPSIDVIFSGFTSHSNASYSGLNIAVNGDPNRKTICRNVKVYRNQGYGIRGFSANYATYENFEVFGNLGWGIYGSAGLEAKITNLSVSGDLTYSQGSGWVINGGIAFYQCEMINCNFGVADTYKRANTTDISHNYGIQFSDFLICRNCKFLSQSTPVSGWINESPWIGGYLAFCDHQGVVGDTLTYMRTGQLQTDTTIKRTSPRSLRLIPRLSAMPNEKHKSEIKQIPARSGDSVTISVYVRRSVAGDGTAYNGALPRLMLKASARMGVSNDTVLATATATSLGAWEQITGVTSAASADGVFEIYVDCDGSTGWINVQDWALSW